jgi:hypothetical protein
MNIPYSRKLKNLKNLFFNLNTFILNMKKASDVCTLYTTIRCIVL